MRLVALVPLVLATAAGAQVVFKCQEAGHTVYSDAPCSGEATVLDQAALRGNTTHADAPRRASTTTTTTSAGAALPAVTPAPAPAPAVIPGPNRIAAGATCPGDEEIRDIETKLTSIDFANGRRRSEREFLEGELRRARACRIEGGSYSAQDWRRIKEAQDDQGNIRGVDRKKARSQALAIHARDASEAEHQRMQADQQKEAAREAARRAQAANASRIITSCDGGGCWDNRGTRYNGTGATFFTSDGKTCTRAGTMLNCN